MKDDKPYLMQIETSTVCNAHCLMCPRDKATRSNHRNEMPEALFWNIIRQAHDFGIRQILPFIDAEPLADPRMVGFVEGIAAHYPEVEVGFYTNASLLTADKARRLLKTGAIKHFNVSMQGGNQETYEKVMGLAWPRTIANVEKLIAINQELGHPVSIRMNMCNFGPTTDSVEEFRARWEPKGCLICLGAFSNFGGLTSDELGEAPWRNVPRQICNRATRHVYVFWNGDVGQCCFDLLGSAIYGNLNKQYLVDIWHSEKARAMREAHRQLDVNAMPPICKNCNSSRFNG